MPFFTLTILSLHDFRPEYNNQWLPQILPILHQLVRSSPSHPLFISSLLAFTPYWPVAEETLIDQAVGSSSPPQSPVPASPRIQPASPQPEVSALPNHPSSTQLATQEPSTKPERSPSLIQETRNDVSMNIYPFYFRLINHPQFGKLFFSGSSGITTQFFFCCG
jgi:hypothetical protein